ncbi:CAP domain-containing protein [Bacillus sp. 1NLA3E]|uniref:CAP domain-containing protein n=1 Tax=Bacillus sp. 1NLA3E TaxID=666686 RepID=UPI000247E9EB|nr:CAP domain-containing protein [Bacillus sp. 1NLA3E]
MKLKKEVITFFFILFVWLCFEKNVYAVSKYTVQSGDTFWKISLIHGVNFESLLRENPQVVNPNIIFPGDTLYLPDLQLGRKNELEKMLHLINKERSSAGLPLLINDEKLSAIADKKALDMKNHGYVSHKSPTYGNPTVMLSTFHIPFSFVLENIGAGPTTADEMFSTWVNSQVNLSNILEKRATHVGIGYARGGLHGHYWTAIIIEKNRSDVDGKYQ